VTIDGARGILINITGGPDLTMHEVSDAVSMIEDSAHEDAHIIFGYVILDEPSEDVKITVIATGFSTGEETIEKQARQSLYTSSRSSLHQARLTDHTGRISTTAAPHRTADAAGEQVQIQTPGSRVSTIRHTAQNERDLDIPAFIRKHSE
jgi:cell division protein FtsZ